LEWKQIEEFPLYEICKETKEVRHIVTKNIKKEHGDSGNIRLYKDGKELSRKVDKLLFATFPDVVKGVKLPNYSKYLIVEDGRIYSVYTAEYIKPTITKKGYLHVDLITDDHTNGDTLVHRLVAKAYLGEPTDCNAQVNHIDGNKANNHVSNLEWCNQNENLLHAVSTGLYESKMRKCKVSTDNGVTWVQYASFADAGRALSINKSLLRECALSNLGKESGFSKTHNVIVMYIGKPVKYNTNLINNLNNRKGIRKHG
jgi:hypothetical protein